MSGSFTGKLSFTGEFFCESPNSLGTYSLGVGDFWENILAGNDPCHSGSGCGAFFSRSAARAKTAANLCCDSSRLRGGLRMAGMAIDGNSSGQENATWSFAVYFHSGEKITKVIA
jgi:hypothetical protein